MLRIVSYRKLMLQEREAKSCLEKQRKITEEIQQTSWEDLLQEMENYSKHRETANGNILQIIKK